MRRDTTRAIAMKLSIIIPTLNEAAQIVDTLKPLQPLRQRGHEVIIVDGWSDDDTLDLAQPWADKTLRAKPGRAHQMNAGAAQASGDILLFLHADTVLPENADHLIFDNIGVSGRMWGRFDVRLSGAHPLLRVVEFMMNWRSRLSGIATGDQTMFISRETFEDVDGFPEIPLMEDIALSRILKVTGGPLCLPQTVITSSRRWEYQGILKTIFLMWRLRLAFFFGANPQRLATAYYGQRRSSTFAQGRILVFAKAPIPKAVKTRLMPILTPDQAAGLQRQLVTHTLTTVTSGELAPVELWCAPNLYHPFFQTIARHFKITLKSQAGTDLGVRMGDALRETLMTRRYAVLIGTDCPGYSQDYLYAAFKALQGGADAVLGPAEDGGYVLIGLSRYDPELFQGVNWGSDTVLAETRERLKRCGFHWEELPPLWDVDRPNDLLRLEQEPTWQNRISDADILPH